MIDINYNHPNIRVETKQVSMLYNLPLTLNIKSHVSKKIVWDCKLEDNYWATYANDSIFDIEIKDANNNTIIYREFNILEEENLNKTLKKFKEVQSNFEVNNIDLTNNTCSLVVNKSTDNSTNYHVIDKINLDFWYHISIITDISSNTITIYLNGKYVFLQISDRYDLNNTITQNINLLN